MRPYSFSRVLVFVFLALLFAPAFSYAAPTERTVLLIAGPPSHGPGEHEHNAGVLLFQKCLAGFAGLNVKISLNGWPRDPATFDHVDAIVFYSDGGGKHLALIDDHLAFLRPLIAHDVGLGLIHYAIEPTLAKGQAEFLQWVGGCFEINWSVNPLWEADFKHLPQHPITRGVRPFHLADEWYYHLRFNEDPKGLTPLLVNVPPPSSLSRPDGAHEGNPAVRTAIARGESQTLAWAYERADGGRGFGFSGGHYHRNWANDDVRKFVLNAIVWLAKGEVPETGVSSTLTPEDLTQNLDPKPKKPAPSPAR